MATRPTEINASRILILGGSGVLGSAIAADLRRRGARVMLAGRNPNRLHERATELGPDVPSVVFNLTEPDHATHVIETTVATLGGLDGLINAAGVVAFGSLLDTDDETLDELVATDLIGPLRVMRAALPYLEGGFIVNVTGVVAEAPVAGMSAYSAVKAGLSASTIALGRELRRQGVHVLDARPPHTETGLASRPISGVAPTMPQGLDPEAVARTIVDGVAAGTREIPAAGFLKS